MKPAIKSTTKSTTNPTTKLFNGKKLRAVYDNSKKTWLVSVIDVISAIASSTYDTARNYWKQLKLRLRNLNHPLIRKTRQIKLVAKDGLHRFTDVMDYKEIVKLIQALPYKVAQRAKNWIGGLACVGKKVNKILANNVTNQILPKEYHFIRHTKYRQFAVV